MSMIENLRSTFCHAYTASMANDNGQMFTPEEMRKLDILTAPYMAKGLITRTSYETGECFSALIAFNSTITGPNIIFHISKHCPPRRAATYTLDVGQMSQWVRLINLDAILQSARGHLDTLPIAHKHLNSAFHSG